MGCKAGWCKKSTPQGIFTATPSLEGWSTKAKEAPSPHEARMSLRDTNPVFQSLMYWLMRQKLPDWNKSTRALVIKGLIIWWSSVQAENVSPQVECASLFSIKVFMFKLQANYLVLLKLKKIGAKLQANYLVLLK